MIFGRLSNVGGNVLLSKDLGGVAKSSNQMIKRYPCSSSTNKNPAFSCFKKICWILTYFRTILFPDSLDQYMLPDPVFSQIQPCTMFFLLLSIAAPPCTTGKIKREYSVLPEYPLILHFVILSANSIYNTFTSPSS